jgi:hypothetical protein
MAQRHERKRDLERSVSEQPLGRPQLEVLHAQHVVEGAVEGVAERHPAALEARHNLLGH